jgi:hypothetical protein
MSSFLADNTVCIAALWKMMCCQYFARANCRGNHCQYSSPPFIAQGRLFWHTMQSCIQISSYAGRRMMLLFPMWKILYRGGQANLFLSPQITNPSVSKQFPEQGICRNCAFFVSSSVSKLFYGQCAGTCLNWSQTMCLRTKLPEYRPLFPRVASLWHIILGTR